MFDRAQFVAGRSGKLGIQSQYLDGELHLIDNTLAGRLHLCPELKIAKRVVQSISVLVMYIFAFAQWATKRLFHNDAVLVRFFAPSKVQASIAARMNVSIGVYWTPFSTFVAAFARAKTLAHVVAAKAPVFETKASALRKLPAKLAMKRRWWLLPHEGQLFLDAAFVKENV